MIHFKEIILPLLNNIGPTLRSSPRKYTNKNSKIRTTRLPYPTLSLEE